MIETAAAMTMLCGGNPLGYLLCKLQGILNSIIPVLVALGMVYFVWGVVQYFIRNDEEAKKKGRDRIIYGIIGLAVIVSVWGLVNIVVNTFGLQGQTIPSTTFIANNAAASASAGCTLTKQQPMLQDLFGYATCFIQDSVIPLMFAVAIAFFIWGAIKFFIINADEEKKRQQGREFMIWGIIALAVMIGVWGLVKILAATFGITTSVLPGVKP